MKNFFVRIEEAAANFGGAMEADTISKNGRNPKSHKSRGNIKNQEEIS